jgi:branched-chain amino acid transport system permease protein
MSPEGRGLVVRVEGLCKAFGGLQAVTDVSFELVPGEVVALIGPNGAGKTTIFNLITGQLQPDAGSVVVDGKDVTKMPGYLRARLGIGRTFQEIRLFAGISVRENVEVYAQRAGASSVARPFLRPHWTRRESHKAQAFADEALDTLGISRLAALSIDNLSYAEQKLVAIARVLAMGSKVLLLDEPASGVDGVGREQLCSAVEQLRAADLAVCVIEHNLDVVRRLGTHLVFLAEGRVLANGTPEEIFESSELADVYFGSGVVNG